MNNEVQFKSLSAEFKAIDSGNPNGEFEAILSTAAIDRDGESIAPGAFDPLPATIPIYFQHDWMDKSLPIGRGTPYYEGETLKIKGVYGSSVKAQEVRTAVSEGLVSSMSVGYVNGVGTKSVDGAPPTLTKGDLFEASMTGTPVNPTAAVLSSKALAEVKAGARNSKTDQSYIQTAHDALTNAGADCAATKSLKGTKAIVGSYEEKQEEITDAIVEAHKAEIAQLFPDDGEGEMEWKVSIIATFDDRVVYRIGWDDEHEYQAPYTFDGDTATLGSPQAVEVNQVVVTEPAGKAVAVTAKAVAATAGTEDDEISALREIYLALST